MGEVLYRQECPACGAPVDSSLFPPRPREHYKAGCIAPDPVTVRYVRERQPVPVSEERVDYEGLIHIGAHHGECCDLDGVGELGMLLCGAVLDAAERATGKASWGYAVRGRVTVEIPKQPPIDPEHGFPDRLSGGQDE